MKNIILLIFIALLSCSELSKKKELKSEKGNLIESSIDIKENVKLKNDTIQLNENHIIFFRPDKIKYEYLVEKYGQVIIEADSDFGFTTKAVSDTLMSIRNSDKIFLDVINNYTIVIDLEGDKIPLPKEDDSNYGVIIQGSKGKPSKILKGIYPKDFYIEEFFKLYTAPAVD